MDWFASNPYGNTNLSLGGLRKDQMWDVHTAARELIPSAMARGGLASVAFAPTAGQAAKNAFGHTV